MKLQTCAGGTSGSIPPNRANARHTGMREALIWFAVLMGFAFAGSAHAATVVFTFPDGSPFDSSGSKEQTVDGLKLKETGASAPGYILDEGSWIWTGNYVSSSTNISGANGLGIDNSSIGGSTPISNENQSFNPGESWTFTLDLPVILAAIKFNSLGGEDVAQITIGANPPQTFTSADTVSEILTNPFEDLVIPAGTPITFTNSEEVPASFPATFGSWRIGSLTFETVTVPEPSSVLLLGSAGLGMIRQRRRK